ncbi:MAG: XTP/dITP diphosphatase [Candidatus Thermoplasmatota archaeon]|nr:XTP/dITP diphosphatase [Euryarchaeota archaeon]MBU4032003.1 XTP/dITP diphosphatase [Candidatus Thermoplasmatota archaeon]MBU4071612.1 XTP/dITP diphosphatase [Candidatus Thermoplasmatota archaeon]MBU4144371.1 XTP/dITP diphosphatase [Candidatus Thermoplasmatota archaeon]MBU4592769.1 XTP/dITP diphosphatase [Candidatus Thermoplasmatota archaeon]
MRILFGTGNPGKLREVQALFGALDHEVEQLKDEYPEIQADTLEEVVIAGLEWLWNRHNVPIIIDDSGLFIETLKGFPGVYSAYVFKTLGCRGVLKLLEGDENRTAEFRCCAGYVDANGKIITRSGTSPGRIIHEMRGTGGFGYDPIFVPDGMEKTFAELELDIKNRISHRGMAFAMLAKAMKE